MTGAGKLRTRAATIADAPAIAEIYNQGIADRIATFETEPRSRADVERVLAALDARHPAVVVERDGRVVAFAWTSTYRPRACYDQVAELHVILPLVLARFRRIPRCPHCRGRRLRRITGHCRLHDLGTGRRILGHPAIRPRRMTAHAAAAGGDQNR